MNSKHTVDHKYSEKPDKLHNFNDHKKALSLDRVKTITQEAIEEVLVYSSSIERARAPILIHDSFNEVPQRFVNCLNSKSYVRPHMHTVTNQWELMVWLSGEIIAIIFDDAGTVVRKIFMNENGVKVIEIPPFCYHSFVVVSTGAYLEIRNCKYQPNVDRLYSSWSPPENSAKARDYQERLCSAEVGDKLIV